MVSNLRPALASERLSTDFTSNTVRSFKQRQSSSTLRRPLQSSRSSSCRRKAQSGNHQLHFTKDAARDNLQVPWKANRSLFSNHCSQSSLSAAHNESCCSLYYYLKWLIFSPSTLNKILPIPSGRCNFRHSEMNVDLVQRLREQFFSGLLHPKSDRFLLHDITTYSIHPVLH